MKKFHRRGSLFSERGKYKSIGLARVFNLKQSLDVQVAALTAQGCSVVFKEALTSRYQNSETIQLQAALNALNAGDELVVSKLDRLGNSKFEVICLLHELLQKGKHLRTLDGFINTRVINESPSFVTSLLLELCELERSFMQKRTQESSKNIRGDGLNVGGRPKTNPSKTALVLRLRTEGCSYRLIRDQTGLALSTIRRIILDNTL